MATPTRAPTCTAGRARTRWSARGSRRAGPGAGGGATREQGRRAPSRAPKGAALPPNPVLHPPTPPAQPPDCPTRPSPPSHAPPKVASLIGADPKEIIFTSGATESNNLAVKGVAGFYKDRKRHVITTQTEHKCVLDSCR
jgi:hypothetical protein